MSIGNQLQQLYENVADHQSFGVEGGGNLEQKIRKGYEMAASANTSLQTPPPGPTFGAGMGKVKKPRMSAQTKDFVNYLYGSGILQGSRLIGGRKIGGSGPSIKSKEAAARSPWVKHVKDVAAVNKITYSQALKLAKNGAMGYKK